MTTFYTPSISNGETLSRSELDLIKEGFDTVATDGYEDYLVANLDLGKSADSPTFKAFIGTIQKFAFPDNAVKEGFGDCHMLHTASTNSITVYPHIHWSSNAATPSGNVAWKVDYSYARGHGQDPFGTVATDSIPVQSCTAQYQHMIAESNGITLTNLEPDMLVLVRLYRDTADALDTLTGDAFFLRSDFHVQVDSRPTYEKAAPFTKVI